MHVLCGQIHIFHRIVAAADDTLVGNMPLRFQALHNHFENGGFPAAAHAGENLHKRRIGVRHDFVHI